MSGPTPGAQLTLTNADGRRSQVLSTDQRGSTSSRWYCATARVTRDR